MTRAAMRPLFVVAPSGLGDLLRSPLRSIPGSSNREARCTVMHDLLCALRTLTAPVARDMISFPCCGS